MYLMQVSLHLLIESYLKSPVKLMKDQSRILYCFKTIFNQMINDASQQSPQNLILANENSNNLFHIILFIIFHNLE